MTNTYKDYIMSRELKPVKLVLIGAVKGKTRSAHGVNFVDGKAEVTGDYFEKNAEVLKAHYSAVPEAEAAEAQAEWQAEQDALAPEEKKPKGK